MSRASTLKEITWYFTRLGLTGFGGPLALVGAMQRDLVEKRQWMPLQEFTQAFALIKAMPGPIAFQSAVFLARHRGGFLGACIAAVMLNLPAFVAMILLGAFEEAFEASPLVHVALSGMQASALGLILASTKGLFWNFRLRPRFWIFLSLGLVAVTLLPAWEPVLILLGGLASVALARGTLDSSLPKAAIAPFFAFERFPLFGAETSAAVIAASGGRVDALGTLAWNCFKAGAFVFGSGIAIVPVMENDFVQRLHWLTHDEFMNALAFGQITPGPVVITATFIGFKSLGLIGAVTATFSIFLAPFIHMTTWFPHAMKRLSKQKWIGDFLLGALAVVTAAVVTSVLRLAITGDFSWPHAIAFIATFILVLRAKAPAWALIPASGAFLVLIELSRNYLG